MSSVSHVLYSKAARKYLFFFSRKTSYLLIYGILIQPPFPAVTLEGKIPQRVSAICNPGSWFTLQVVITSEMTKEGFV